MTQEERCPKCGAEIIFSKLDFLKTCKKCGGKFCPECGAEMISEEHCGRWHLEAKCSKCDYTCSNYIGPDDGPGTWA